MIQPAESVKGNLNFTQKDNSMDMVELKQLIHKIIGLKEKEGEPTTLKAIIERLQLLCGSQLPPNVVIKLALGSLIRDGIVGSDHQFYIVKKGH